MNALSVLIYDIFLEIFYGKIKIIINFFDSFLYFSYDLCQNFPKIVY